MLLTKPLLLTKPRVVIQGPMDSRESVEKKKKKKTYELYPGRLGCFSRDNEYRVHSACVVGVGGEGWVGGVSRSAGGGVGEDFVASPDEPLVWTLCSRERRGGGEEAEEVAEVLHADALIDVVQSRVSCEVGSDVFFVTALASAMTFSLASDENEWKNASKALAASSALTLLRHTRLGHKQVCNDSGWRALETVCCNF